MTLTQRRGSCKRICLPAICFRPQANACELAESVGQGVEVSAVEVVQQAFFRPG